MLLYSVILSRPLSLEKYRASSDLDTYFFKVSRIPGTEEKIPVLTVIGSSIPGYSIAARLLLILLKNR